LEFVRCGRFFGDCVLAKKVPILARVPILVAGSKTGDRDTTTVQPNEIVM
jgi:hypothetical protein